MNKRSFLKTAVLAVAALVVSATGWSSSYYVSVSGSDSADGSSGAPFATVGKALSMADVSEVLLQTDITLGNQATSKDDKATVIVSGKTVTIGSADATAKNYTGRFVVYGGVDAANATSVTLENLNVSYATTDLFGNYRGVVLTDGSNVELTMNHVNIATASKTDCLFIGRNAGSVAMNTVLSNIAVNLNNSKIDNTCAVGGSAQAVTLRSQGITFNVNGSEIHTDNAHQAYTVAVQGTGTKVNIKDSLITASYPSYPLSVVASNVEAVVDNSKVSGYCAIRYGGLTVNGGTLEVKNGSVLEADNPRFNGTQDCFSALVYEELANNCTATITDSTVCTTAVSYKNVSLIDDRNRTNNVTVVNSVLAPQASVESQVFQSTLSGNVSVAYNVSPTGTFSSVGDALAAFPDLSDSDVDFPVINVAAGTYDVDETIFVDKPVSIAGPFVGVAGSDATRGTGEAIIAPSAAYVGDGGELLLIDSPDVIVEGLTFDGKDQAHWGPCVGATSVIKDSGIFLCNNIVKNFVEDGLLVYAYPGAVNGVTVSGNLLENLGGNAILFYYSAYGVCENNTVNNSAVGIRFDNAFASPNGGSESMTFRNNMVSNVYIGAMTNQLCVNTDVLFTGNTLTNGTPAHVGTYGVSRGFVIWNTGIASVTFADNTVNGFAQGARAWFTSNKTPLLKGNTFNDITENGLFVSYINENPANNISGGIFSPRSTQVRAENCVFNILSGANGVYLENDNVSGKTVRADLVNCTINGVSAPTPGGVGVQDASAPKTGVVVTGDSTLGLVGTGFNGCDS